jgi:hypothetical protein
MPDLLGEEVTAVYAGLRAATEHDDYQIHCHPDQRYVAAASLPAQRTHCHRRRVRHPGLPLRTGQPWEDPRRAAQPDTACLTRRAAPPHPRAQRPVQGFYCGAAIGPLLDQHGATTITHRTSSPSPAQRTVDVLVIGAGKVEILDRQHCAGGQARLWRHTRDPHRYLDAMTRAGASLHTGVTATGWAGARTLDTTSPAGQQRITATAVILAIGARERPRNARWIPGDRPPGVLTTGQLQQITHSRQPVGHRALIVGAEPVSYYALRTLHQAGVEVVAMVTELSRHQSHLTVHLAARWRHRVPLLTGVAITGVVADQRTAACLAFSVAVP